MSRINLFLDSSVLMSGIISSEGASRALLLLSEDGRITIMVSEQVIVEVERNIAKKIPRIISFARATIKAANVKIIKDPSKEDVTKHSDWISHQADIPILVSAFMAKVDYLVTLNTKHFLDDPQVTFTSGLRIGTPGDALAWVREQLKK